MGLVFSIACMAGVCKRQDLTRADWDLPVAVKILYKYILDQKIATCSCPFE